MSRTRSQACTEVVGTTPKPFNRDTHWIENPPAIGVSVAGPGEMVFLTVEDATLRLEIGGEGAAFWDRVIRAAEEAKRLDAGREEGTS